MDSAALTRRIMKVCLGQLHQNRFLAFTRRVRRNCLLHVLLSCLFDSSASVGSVQQVRFYVHVLQETERLEKDPGVHCQPCLVGIAAVYANLGLVHIEL